jgi:hypothetical protein
VSVVYFVQAGASGPIKIGMAADLAQRITILQCGSPEPLVALATAPGGWEEERQLHRRLAAHRHSREWFKPTQAVLDVVAEAKAGTLQFAEPGNRSHSEIMDAVGASNVASLLGVSVHTARSWIRRDSIPAEHWLMFSEHGHATLEELAKAAARKPAQAAA